MHAAVVRVPRPRGRSLQISARCRASAQGLEEQKEFAEREHMPFPRSRIPSVGLVRVPPANVRVRRPRFTAGDARARVGARREVFYPVFPPDQDAHV
jgi:hypothetical protein